MLIIDVRVSISEKKSWDRGVLRVGSEVLAARGYVLGMGCLRVSTRGMGENKMWA
jgi:hypothetical protein